jgi:hypothetical protein
MNAITNTFLVTRYVIKRELTELDEYDHLTAKAFLLVFVLHSFTP